MNCVPCGRNNKSNQADKYCVQCQEYFCTRCIEMHKNFTLLVHHSLIEITARSQIPASVEEKESTDIVGKDGYDVLQVPTERCSKHPAKVVDMYCRAHDIVGCSVCFAPHYK